MQSSVLMNGLVHNCFRGGIPNHIIYGGTGKCMFYKISLCTEQAKCMYISGHVSLCQPSVNGN